MCMLCADTEEYLAPNKPQMSSPYYVVSHEILFTYLQPGNTDVLILNTVEFVMFILIIKAD